MTLAHLMAMAALGLLVGQQRWSDAITAAYAAAVLAGLGAIAMAYVPTRAEEGLLAATALAGLLLAWARSWPKGVGAVLAAAIGLTLALDSPPQALSVKEADIELAVTAIVAIAALWVIAMFGRRLQRPWLRLGVRILGAWIAACAILVLALHLARWTG